ELLELAGGHALALVERALAALGRLDAPLEHADLVVHLVGEALRALDLARERLDRGALGLGLGLEVGEPEALALERRGDVLGGLAEVLLLGEELEVAEGRDVELEALELLAVLEVALR